MSIQWLCISVSFRIYTFRSPWQRRINCSIIWLVSLIVKLREMVWTICARSPLSLAAWLILASSDGINRSFRRGSWLANCRSIHGFIGALSSLWARVACCSWWMSSVVRAVSDRLGWLMWPSLSQSSLKLCPSNDRPCLPNICVPLKQMAFWVSLESIRRKLV